jgi:prepilin peptidase CpaA
MGLTFAQAAWLLPVALPISLWVAWSDMRRMRIPNTAVYALAAGFAVLGLMAMPFSDWLWRWSHLAVVLVIGFAMNMARLMGAGDAKFAAAAAPYVALQDLVLMLYLLAACFLAAYVLHRIAKYSPIRRLTPDWHSWQSGKRFPMGVALGGALVTYLTLGLFGG